MNLTFAVSPGKKYIGFLNDCDVQNVLVSYHFIKNPNKLIEYFNGKFPKNLILDSGAFSVWANGGTVDIDKYAQFAKDMQRLLPESVNLYVVNLDVLPGKIGERPTPSQREESAIAGWNNMEYLEAKGLKVIHVFHQHEDFKWLNKLRAHSDYIGISPANDVSQIEKNNWLNKVFAITRDTVKTHGFAVTSYTQLYKYPFYSVDSSSWTAPARFGRIPIFTDDLKMKSFQYKEIDEVHKHWEYISKIGIAKLGGDEYEDRIKVAIKSYLELERIATQLWDKRGVKYDIKRTS